MRVMTSGQPLRSHESVPSKSKITCEISARGKPDAGTARCSLADEVTSELRHFCKEGQRVRIAGKINLQTGRILHRTGQPQNYGLNNNLRIKIKTMNKLLFALTFAAFAAFSTLPVAAADAKPAAAPAARPFPFNGKIDSVDKQAKTIKVGERVFHVTPTTRIIKDGKPATLDNAKVGDEVGGAYREGEEKKLNLLSLRIGPKPAAPGAAPKKDAPAK